MESPTKATTSGSILILFLNLELDSRRYWISCSLISVLWGYILRLVYTLCVVAVCSYIKKSTQTEPWESRTFAVLLIFSRTFNDRNKNLIEKQRIIYITDFEYFRKSVETTIQNKCCTIGPKWLDLEMPARMLFQVMKFWKWSIVRKMKINTIRVKFSSSMNTAQTKKERTHTDSREASNW